MICIGCNKYPISNKHFKLCNYCNEKRLNEKKKKKRSSFGRISKQRTTSSTKQIILKEKRESFRREVYARGHTLCQGCLGSSRLTISHIIPISIRKDLEFELENIQLECMTCHTKWEHGSLETKKQLLNYHVKIDYIKRVDNHYYERKFNKD